MTTQSLKLNTNIINNNNIENRTFKAFIYIIIFLSLCYVLVLGNMVWNIVARKNIDAQARTLGNEVNNLELQYLSLSGKVDMKMAYSMGFKEINKTFAKRENSLGSLSVMQNEL
ncbi:MAG: hypothetical protein NT068_01545 [Candidatus Nomurabacteria bacterium]|nr:hypothetical protein [Candidatus Nomurabacteria bacterium]